VGVSAGPADSDREIQASRRLLRVSEWELQQLLLDIHDGPVQAMYAALSQLDLLSRALDKGDEAGRADVAMRADRIRLLLETGLREIRSFIGAIRPPKFEHQALGDLIESFAIQHEATTDTAVHLDLAATIPDLPVSTKIAVYRVVQEALSNAYRHGGAHRVDIRAAVRESVAGPLLRVSITDNGAGFELDLAAEDGHFGLSGMQARVEMIGGQFTLLSTVGRGTSITLEVPLSDRTSTPSLP
jgi:signal transduction histidine kinase